VKRLWTPLLFTVTMVLLPGLVTYRGNWDPSRMDDAAYAGAPSAHTSASSAVRARRCLGQACRLVVYMGDCSF
jgi:hypothetical protein